MWGNFLKMEDKSEIALKRIEQVKKEIDEKLEKHHGELDKLFQSLFSLIYDSKLISTQAIRDSTLTRYFLADNNIIDKRGWVKYFKSHPLANNYLQEIMLYHEIIDDISNKNFKDTRNLIFMEDKRKFRELELHQIVVNRMKLMVKRLKEFEGNESAIEELEKEIKLMESKIKQLFNEDLRREKRDEKQEITKKEEAEKIITEYIEKNKEEFIERFRYLPKNDIQTHLEPYIKQLYGEAKQLYWLGRYNASIIISCVILEAVLKDVIKFKEEKKSVELDFEDVINHCKSKEYITDSEKAWLIDVKGRFRNPYLHANLEKILPYIMVPGVAINLKQKVEPEFQMITTRTLPTLRDILKPEFDKEEALKLFKGVHGFINEISKRYFDTTKEPV